MLSNLLSKSILLVLFAFVTLTTGVQAQNLRYAEIQVVREGSRPWRWRYVNKSEATWFNDGNNLAVNLVADVSAEYRSAVIIKTTGIPVRSVDFTYRKKKRGTLVRDTNDPILRIEYFVPPAHDFRYFTHALKYTDDYNNWKSVGLGLGINPMVVTRIALVSVQSPALLGLGKSGDFDVVNFNINRLQIPTAVTVWQNPVNWVPDPIKGIDAYPNQPDPLLAGIGPNEGGFKFDNGPFPTGGLRLLRSRTQSGVH